MSAKKGALFGVVWCVSYALLLFSEKGISYLFPPLHGSAGFLMPAAVAFLAFFVPGFALQNLSSAGLARKRARPKFSELAGFTIALSIFFGSLGFFMAYFFHYNIIFPCYSAATSASAEPMFLWVIFGLILPVFFEEYLLRGVVYRALARSGTILGIIASSLFYALLQDTLSAFWGALILGAVFCVITEFTSSPGPVAVIRLSCILYYQVFSKFVETYAVYGQEYVFLILNLIILLISCYFILLHIERFLKKGRKFNYKKVPSPQGKTVSSFLLNPGILAFCVLYIMRVSRII